MTISDFSKIARQTTAADMVVGQQGGQQDGQGGIELRKPLNPPSAWTGFKAALSNVPLLGQLGSLRQARQEVDSYPVRLGEYQASNRQILAGFVQDLQASYGTHAAKMAMKNVDVADGKPLSQRMVKTALDNADKAQKQMRAMNNLQITQFLENPMQGGVRLPGKVDMTDVCFQRNMPVGGQPSWQHAVGTESAKFITRMTEGLCRSQPEHARQMLSNETIAAAANQALDVYQTLLSTPDMTPARLEGILQRANEKAGSGHQAMLSFAKELAITTRLDEQISRQDPQSMLNRIATQVQGSMRGEIDALGLPPPGLNLAPVLKSVANGISETVSFGMSGLAQQLGCANDVPSIARALDGALPGKMEQALREHVQALTMIQQSPTLTDAQKAELLAIANTRRIDPVQVQKYEAIAQTISDATVALKAYAQGTGGVDAVFKGLERALSAFENETVPMKEHGATMWESGSLSGGDMTTELMDQFARLAAASLSADDAKALLPLIGGAEVARLMEAMNASSDMRMAAQLPITLMSLVQGVAQRAGETPQGAQALARGLTHGTPEGLNLGTLRPDLALALLTDPEKMDARGVVTGSPNAGLIAQDFDPGAILDANRQAIQDYVNSDALDDASGLPRTTLVDMGRATFRLNGEHIGGGGDQAGEVRERFEGAFTNDQAPLARGVARCMNQLGINMFVGLNNQAAYGQGNVVAGAPGVGHTVHEAWQQDDGTWLVRSIHTQRPNALSKADGSMEEISTDGLAAFSITYRVSPGAQPGDEAVITVEDSRVAYAI